MNIQKLQDSIQQHPKRALALFIGGVLSVIVAVWFINHSFVTVHLKGYGENESSVTVTVVNQADVDDVQVVRNVESDSLSFTLSRGSYELYAADGNTKSFAAVEVSGFLSRQSATLQRAQQNRQAFVGNDTHGCAQLIDRVLYSWRCGEAINDAKRHEPATTSNPTATRSLRGPSVWGVATFTEPRAGEQQVVLQRESHNHESGGVSMVYGRYPVVSLSADISSGVTYPRLDSTKNYIFERQEVNSALVAHSIGESNVETFTDGLNNTSTHVQPSQNQRSVNLVGAGATNSNYGLGALFIDASLFTTLFSNQFEGMNAELETEGSPPDASAAIFVCEEGCPGNEYTLPPSTTQALLCDEQTLCAVDNNGLSVYELDQDTAKRASRVTGVSKILLQNDTLFVLRPDGVMSIELGSTLRGSYSVVSAQATCGITASSGGFLLCVEGKRAGSDSVLFVNPTETTSLPVLSVVDVLQNHEAIANISVYRNKIFVVPELGELVPNPQTGTLHYPDSRVEESSRSINALADELRLKEHGYNIINVYD